RLRDDPGLLRRAPPPPPLRAREYFCLHLEHVLKCVLKDVLILDRPRPLRGPQHSAYGSTRTPRPEPRAPSFLKMGARESKDTAAARFPDRKEQAASGGSLRSAPRGRYFSGKNRSATASCSGTSGKKLSRWQ